MTDFPIKAKVACSDGPCGKSTLVIVNTKELTVSHTIVKDKSFPEYPDRIVPFAKIKQTNRDLITLDCTQAEVADMQPFTTQRLVHEEVPDYADSYLAGDPEAFTNPVMDSDSWYESVPQENMPMDGVAIYSGMAVKTSKHKVGKVDEMMVDPDSGKITHLVMSEGHLWGVKDIAIPTSDIEFVDTKVVYLKIDKDAVGALLEVPRK